MNKRLEQLLERAGSVNLRRVGWNAFWGGLLGSLFVPSPLMIPLGALSGVGLTLYDEIYKKGMNLGFVWGGVFFGGLIGDLLEDKSTNILSYTGAGIGGTLGLVKAYARSYAAPLRRQKAHTALPEAQEPLRLNPEHTSQVLDHAYQQGGEEEKKVILGGVSDFVERTYQQDPHVFKEVERRRLDAHTPEM